MSGKEKFEPVPGCTCGGLDHHTENCWVWSGEHITEVLNSLDERLIKYTDKLYEIYKSK